MLKYTYNDIYMNVFITKNIIIQDDLKMEVILYLLICINVKGGNMNAMKILPNISTMNSIQGIVNS